MYFNPLCWMSYSLFINRRSDFKLIMISLDTKWFQLKATVRKKITTKIIMLYNSSYSNMSLWVVRAFLSQPNILYLQCKHIHTDEDFAILNTRDFENGHLQCSPKTASILAFAFSMASPPGILISISISLVAFWKSVYTVPWICFPISEKSYLFRDNFSYI